MIKVTRCNLGIIVDFFVNDGTNKEKRKFHLEGCQIDNDSLFKSLAGCSYIQYGQILTKTPSSFGN